MQSSFSIRLNGLNLPGQIKSKNPRPKGWVIFAHGSGSSRNSPRNKFVAEVLSNHGYGTFLFDLLTPDEDMDFDNRFDIDLLAERLKLATESFVKSSFFHGEPIAFFGASTGSAAALMATASIHSGATISTVISRGGRPDLVDSALLNKITCPVLLIVGDRDLDVLKLNRKAADELSNARISLIKGATHLFSEPGTLEDVASLVVNWLDENLSLTYSGINP